MNINKLILTIIILFPFVAYLIQPFYRFVPMSFLFVLIIIGIISNISLDHGAKNPSKITILYFSFVVYLVALDIIRFQPFGAGYNMLFTLPMLYFIDQVYISKEFKEKIDKYLIYIFYVSFVTILIQQLYNSSFFVSDRWEQSLNSEDIYIQRLPSIFSWISMTAPLFTFPPILGIVIQEQLNKGKSRKAIIFLILGLFIAFLTKGRSTVLYVLVISSQLLFFSSLRFSNYLRYLITIVLFFLLAYNILLFFGLPLKEIFFFRFMEGGKDLESTSVYARISNFQFFFSNLKEFWLLGTGNQINEVLAEEMDRRSNKMLIGVLDPFFRYGIIAFLLYLIFIFHLLKKFYKTAKLSRCYGAFLGMLGYLVMNLTANSLHLFQVGLIILFIYEKFYRQQLIVFRPAIVSGNITKNIS